jgi:hypothetical protein
LGKFIEAEGDEGAIYYALCTGKYGEGTIFELLTDASLTPQIIIY